MVKQVASKFSWSMSMVLRIAISQISVILSLRLQKAGSQITEFSCQPVRKNPLFSELMKDRQCCRLKMLDMRKVVKVT